MLSERELDERLDRRGVRVEARREARDVLDRAGYLDDARLARERAAVLAARGHGDAAIRWDLERRGVDAGLAEDAVATVEPESVRANRIVAQRGAGPRTARYLAARGFGEDAVEAAGEANVARDT